MENKIAKLITQISCLNLPKHLLAFRGLYLKIYRRYTVVTEIFTIVAALGLFCLFIKLGAYIILYIALYKTGDVSMMPNYSDFHFLIP